MRLNLCALVLALAVTTTAWAGPFTDEMSKCLVKSTSEADKTLLIKWIFAAMSAHPDVRALSSVTPQQGDQLNQQTAQVVMRLLTHSCKHEARQAVVFEGEDTFKASFEVLGRVAMQGLMSDAGVAGYFNGFEKHLDGDALQRALYDPQKAAPAKK